MKYSKKILSILLSVVMVLGVCAVAPVTVNAADDGIVWKDAEQRYEISDYDGLRTFAKIVNGEVNPNNLTNPQFANAILKADIDASVSNPDHPDYDAETNAWTPIGKDYSHAYTGTFDGNGYIIKNLTYDNPEQDYAGLFGYVGTKTEGGVTTKGTVKNVGLEGGSITGNYIVGGVVGLSYGTVTNCCNTGTVSGSNNIGGVVGLSYGTVINCYNTGDVTASGEDATASGVVGLSYGTVTNCCNTGTVSGSNNIGGVVGLSHGTVINCYNTGSVKATGDRALVGGVAGYIANNAIVSNCYNTGAVSGNGNVGGVAGFNSNEGKASDCFYNSDRCAGVSALGRGSGTNVEGLTTAQMTGANALENLTFAYEAGEESPWLTKADGADENGGYYWFYPHLKGFAYDRTSAAEDWPAKVEITVGLSDGNSCTYDGEKHGVYVTVGDSSAPEGATVTYSQYKYSNENNKWEWEEISDSPTDPGKYRMTIRNSNDEVVETKYFTILSPDTDYTIKYYKNLGDGWSSESVNPVDVGEYKAVVTFTDTGYAKGHAPIEKEFSITPKSLSSDMINAIPDVTYNGSALTPVITVTDGSKTLTEGIDYIVYYSGNIDVARDANGNVIAGAKAIVTGMGNYTGIVEKPFKITPKAVTITANSDQKAYDGSALTRSGFTASALEAGDTHEFTVAMTAGSTITDFGTTENVIATVDGVNVTAGTATPVGNYNVTTVNGTLTVTKATAIVTITGNNNSAPYDGKEHSVSGYTATASNELYDVTKDFTFSGTAEASRTDSGRTNMGLSADQFTNTNPNFDVTFNVDSDGYQNIVPLNVEVTITGNSETADYDGQEHSASGYTFDVSNPLYKEGDFTFSGTAEAKLTEPGTESMGLDASQFTNTNTNFDTVTFVIAEDGKITVNPVIKFVNEDGTVLQSSAYAMGETPEYKGETPTKEASDGCTYEFAGWTPAITEVTGNATYTAVYTSTAIGLELKDGINETTGYKEDQTFTVDTSNLPEGAEVHWFVNGEDVGTGSSYKVEDPTEDYTVQAKVIDSDGNVLAETETQKVHVKNGFFDRIKAFFTELIAQILGKAIADLLFSVC